MDSFDPDLDQPRFPLSAQTLHEASVLADAWGRSVFVVGKEFCNECGARPCECPCDDSMMVWHMVFVEVDEVCSSDLILAAASP